MDCGTAIMQWALPSILSLSNSELLVRIHASINQKRLIGHIGVDYQHHDGFNHVFRLAQPTNRNAWHQLAFSLMPDWQLTSVGNQCGSHRVDRHSMRSKR